MPLASFDPATRSWFEAAFPEATRVQREGWPAIARGEHTLLVAPTGSGKTLAAFLWGIDRVSRLPDDAEPGVRVLYVSPLKALVHDVERNLRAPLAGLQRHAERLGRPLRPVRVDVRTGDTPQKARRQQARNPAEILVTTPESLFLILGSNARETLRTVHTVIVDEIHAFAPSKRGVHLALSLERLAALCEEDPQRIGLSATVRPLDAVASFLGGDRETTVVDASDRPALDLRIAVPVPDMERPPPVPVARPRGGSLLGPAGADPPPQVGVGLWPSLYPAILEQIRAHRSTLLFVNSRGLCERLTTRLNELAGEEVVRAHHGSISHARRAAIEEDLKAGRVKGLVATSSLELGIDMGAVDLVLLVESPGSVARGLQRVGRAGHGVGETSRGVIFPKFRGDLLECAVVAGRMRQGALEALQVPRNALDVLAQQLVAMCVERPRTVDDLERTVRRASPYRDLSREVLLSVLDLLTGRWSDEAFADLRPRLAWDRSTDVLTARRGARSLVVLNGGTIPDRGTFPVFVAGKGPRVGELDEEMVHETRKGDVILLGASSWRVAEIGRDRVEVVPAPGEPGRMPFWRGEGPGRPIELGEALGALLRELAPLERAAMTAHLRETLPLDAWAADNLAAYVSEQRAHTGTLPTDRAVTVERFRDELGDWRVCILTPFGARVHGPWALALEAMLSARAGFAVQTMYSDDGIVLRLADTEETPGVDALLPDPEEVEDLLLEQLADSALFAGLFRENAARALLLPRRGFEARTPLWQQRLAAKSLLAAVRRHPTFPILLETYRQCLQDVFDLPALLRVLRGLRDRTIRVDDVETPSPSPFSRSLVFAWVATWLYELDAPLAERRAQALTLDRDMLRELLGDTELRELLDPVVLDEVEAELQGLADGRRARDPDELHDLLRRLGALDEEALAARSTADPRPWLALLEGQRRAARIRIAGADRWIASVDAARYRDALGCVPPAGLPDALLLPVEDALVGLVRRLARTRGPFPTRAIARALDLLPAQVEPVLRALERDGLLVRGALRPGGEGLEWCDAEVLRTLKRRTLARLRSEVAPVDAAALARFLPAWHGMDGDRAGPSRLEEVIAQLEGAPLPWSALLATILPARVPGFRPEMLDLLGATGAVVWVGRGAIGASDGRIALFRRDRVGLLLDPPEPLEEEAPLHRALLAHLEERGASFTAALQAVDPTASPDEVRAALWDLVWGGRITNDTFQPLRSLGQPARGRRGGLAALAGGRWSLVAPLSDPETSPTARAHARATMLLDRYGLASREAALADEIPGGFGAVYRVLAAMEEAGRVRRGWFVEGLSAAQFAVPGAVDRLRALRREDAAAVRVIPAVDPANPWGSLLPWPETRAPGNRRARRVPGAFLVLVGGLPVLFVEPGARGLQTFPAFDEPERGEAALRALGSLPGRRRMVRVERVDGLPVRESPHRATLRAAGFAEDPTGLVLVER